MRDLLNLIWLIFGGFLIAIEYLVSSFVLIITIIGIPFGLQSLKMASLAVWPFGRRVVQSPHRNGNGCIYTLMNVIWIVVGGIWISLTHLVLGVVFAITIIGLPFANQHFKLASLSLTPFGKEIIPE
jgi:uncharacterized membrane protein YccF (DUF307 family)